MLARLAVGCAFLIAALFGSPLRAEEAPGADDYHQGQAAYEAGNFGAAAQSFEKAYLASHKAALLWNIAQSYRRQYDIEGSVASLKRALVVYRNFGELAQRPEERADAAKAAAEVEALLAAASQPPVVAAPVVTAAPVIAPAPVVAPRADVVVAPPVTATPTQPTPSRRWPWVVVGVAAAVLIVAGALIVGLTPGDSTPMTAGGNFMPTLK